MLVTARTQQNSEVPGEPLLSIQAVPWGSPAPGAASREPHHGLTPPQEGLVLFSCTTSYSNDFHRAIKAFPLNSVILLQVFGL